jgi:hypothetical protein
MSIHPPLRQLVVFISISVLIFSLSACKPNPPPASLKKSGHTLTQIFTVGGKFADDSMYACLADALAQRIPYKQALKLCETKLLESGLAGFGESSSGPLGGLPGGGKPFDPSKVTSSCSTGDPTRTQPSGGGKTNYVDPAGQNWGPYSWGSGSGYNGMTHAESRAAKESAIKDAKNADAVAIAADAARTKINQEVLKRNPPGAQTIVNATWAANAAATKAANEANRKAQADPNANTPAPSSSTSSSASSSGTSTSSASSTSTGGGSSTGGSTSSAGSGSGGSQHGTRDSVCQKALQQAREFLYECNRNGWKTTQCQQLNAKMNGCPDPTLILVDPEQGYTCGDTPDPMAVVIAAREKCQQLKRGVDGTDPCGIPSFDGMTLTAQSLDICSDPVAYVDPENGACITTLTLPDMGTDVQEIIVFALNKFGGPVIVLPTNPKPIGWSPRPEPRPGPR